MWHCLSGNAFQSRDRIFLFGTGIFEPNRLAQLPHYIFVWYPLGVCAVFVRYKRNDVYAALAIPWTYRPSQVEESQNSVATH